MNREPQTLEFQTEVRQLLDIVINSLYTDREIFIRELLSNASDAMEKFRLLSLMESDFHDQDAPLEITIEADEKNHTLTIADAGIGMTREELVENLGTIAHSGSKEFIKKLEGKEQKDLQLIGQFGVGFYSVFMVSSDVRVQTLSYRPEATGWTWSSNGTGSYTVSPADGLRRGTKIIIHLKEDAYEFAKPDRVKEIVKKYSNFVSFNISVNGEAVNTVQAIWTRNKSEVTEEEYNQFYKFLTNAFTDPLYRLHISSDAPIQLNALFFIPAENFERFGFSRLEPGVNLYCRKVLIQQKSRDILPEYMRFIKGVVDSEDLPLNISREVTQNTRLIARIRKFLTRRLLSFLEEQAAADKEKYNQFWENYSLFIKEGCVSNAENRGQLAKLLRFQSSKSADGETVSLAEYAGRMKEGQKSIYYINGPSRESIEAGPYLEAFKARDIEVLFLLDAVDDFVMTSLKEFQEKKLVSADQSDLDLPPSGEQEDGDKAADGRDMLTEEEIRAFTKWMKDILSDTISDIKPSRRLVDSPAIVVNPDQMMTTSMQRVMQAADRDFGGFGPKVLEINTRHKVIVQLARLSTDAGADQDLLRSCAEQIADNAFIAAGLPGDRNKTVDRIYGIMDKALAKVSQDE